MLIGDLNGQCAIAKLPLRTIDPWRAELLLDQKPGKARRVDEKIGLEAQTAFGFDSGDLAALGHFHLGHVIEMVGDAASRRDFAEVVGELQRVHVKRVGKTRPDVVELQSPGREIGFADHGLRRDRLGKRYRTIAHQPVHRRRVDRPGAVTTEGVVIALALPVQPVDVFDGLLVRALDTLQKLDFVDADNRQDVRDARNGRLANAYPRYVRRLEQGNIDRTPTLGIECRVEVSRRHPARRSAADDQ